MANENLVRAVEDCLKFYDPQDFIAIGCPADEYRPEAEMIAEGLLNLPSKFTIQQKIYRVFVEMFDEKTAGPFKSYEPIAADLFDLKHTFGRTYKVR